MGYGVEYVVGYGIGGGMRGGTVGGMEWVGGWVAYGMVSGTGYGMGYEMGCGVEYGMGGWDGSVVAAAGIGEPYTPARHVHVPPPCPRSHAPTLTLARLTAIPRR